MIDRLALAIWVGVATLMPSICQEAYSAPTTQPTLDGRHEFVLPDGWKSRTDPKGDYQLIADSGDHRAHIAVLSDFKEDLVDMTPEGFLRMFHDMLAQSSKEVALGEAVAIVVNGYRASEVEMKAVTNGKRGNYYCVAIETPNSLVLVACYTSPSRYVEQREAFRQIIDSFRERRAGTAGGSPTSTQPTSVPVEGK